MITIGITGTTGAGKTTALRELEKLGGTIIDCDAVYHRLLEQNLSLQKELEDRFGPLRSEDGAIDRKKLGRVVFHDPAALEDLNGIAHKFVGAAVDEILTKARTEGRPAAAIDAIGLFESGLSDRCDTTLAITAPPEIRVERIMLREGISREYAQSRVDAQHSEDYYTSHCDHVLINNCPSAEVFGAQAKALFEQILAH